jgi:hypothetical protein
MARISKIKEFNRLRIDDTWLPFQKKTISFENQKGDTMVITPVELKEELDKFIDLHFSSMTSDDIETKKEYLKRELDIKLNEFELSLRQHVDNKITKITQDIIENVMSRTFEERVKQEVKKRLKKLLDE